MKMHSILAAAKIGFIILFAQGLAAEAAEVKVIAGTGIQEAMEELGLRFERATGHKLAIWYGHVFAIQRRLEAGEAFDVLVTNRSSLDEYTKQGKIAGGTHAAIAQVGMGVAARAGAPKPDISTIDAFKRAMLDAKSVAYNPEGAGGVHVASVFERLRIAEQMKRKTNKSAAKRVLQSVADGEAEFGFALTNQILSFSGLQLVGSLPPGLQRYMLYTAGLAAAAEQTEASNALVKFLTSPAAVAVIKAKGMEPGTP